MAIILKGCLNRLTLLTLLTLCLAGSSRIFQEVMWDVFEVCKICTVLNWRLYGGVLVLLPSNVQSLEGHRLAAPWHKVGLKSGHRHHQASHLRLRQTWLLMIFFFFLPWLLILIPLYTHEEVDWYKDMYDMCTCTEFTRCWDWAVKSRGRSTTSTRQIPIWILE